MPRAYVALGGNIDPARLLPRAAQALRERFAGARFSPCYRNPAFGFAGPDFHNAVAGFDTDLDVPELLAHFEAIEALCGRRRDDAKWAPRAMDLDLLLYGGHVEKTGRWELPRPDLLRRNYMLGPLADLAPELRHPLTGRTIGEHWRDMVRDPQGLERLPLDLNAAA